MKPLTKLYFNMLTSSSALTMEQESAICEHGKKHDTTLLEYLAYRPTLTEATHAALRASKSPDVTRAWLVRSDMPLLDALDRLRRERRRAVRLAVARHTETRPELLSALSGDLHDEVLQAVLLNPNTPDDTLLEVVSTSAKNPDMTSGQWRVLNEVITLRPELTEHFVGKIRNPHVLEIFVDMPLSQKSAKRLVKLLVDKPLRASNSDVTKVWEFMNDQRAGADIGLRLIKNGALDAALTKRVAEDLVALPRKIFRPNNSDAELLEKLAVGDEHELSMLDARHKALEELKSTSDTSVATWALRQAAGGGNTKTPLEAFYLLLNSNLSPSILPVLARSLSRAQAHRAFERAMDVHHDHQDLPNMVAELLALRVMNLEDLDRYPDRRDEFHRAITRNIKACELYAETMSSLDTFSDHNILELPWSMVGNLPSSRSEPLFDLNASEWEALNGLADEFDGTIGEMLMVVKGLDH